MWRSITSYSFYNLTTENRLIRLMWEENSWVISRWNKETVLKCRVQFQWINKCQKSHIEFIRTLYMYAYFIIDIHSPTLTNVWTSFSRLNLFTNEKAAGTVEAPLEVPKWIFISNPHIPLLIFKYYEHEEKMR